VRKHDPLNFRKRKELFLFYQHSMTKRARQSKKKKEEEVQENQPLQPTISMLPLGAVVAAAFLSLTAASEQPPVFKPPAYTYKRRRFATEDEDEEEEEWDEGWLQREQEELEELEVEELNLHQKIELPQLQSSPASALEIARKLVKLNPKMRVWMSDTKKEELLEPNVESIVERLERMKFVFLANFPLTDDSILGAGEKGSGFEAPDDMMGFTRSDKVCFTAFPILAWVKQLRDKLKCDFAFLDVCAIAGTAASGGASDNTDPFKVAVTSLTVSLVRALSSLQTVLCCGHAAAKALLYGCRYENTAYGSSTHKHKFATLHLPGKIIKVVYSYTHLCLSFVSFKARIMLRALFEALYQMDQSVIASDSDKQVVSKMMSGRTGKPLNIVESLRLLLLSVTKKQQLGIWKDYLSSKHVKRTGPMISTPEDAAVHESEGKQYLVTDDVLATWYCFLGGT